MMLIRLTLPNNKPCVVNTATITYITYITPTGTVSRISFNDGDEIFVQETLDEIMAMYEKQLERQHGRIAPIARGGGQTANSNAANETPSGKA